VTGPRATRRGARRDAGCALGQRVARRRPGRASGSRHVIATCTRRTGSGDT
jgi:hypothetical protein